jgi:Flp pilus assembly protein TadD
MKQLILLLLLLPATVQAQIQQSHQEYLHSASQTFAQGDYEQALIILQQAEELADTVQAQAVTQNAIGWTYHNLGQDDKARKYLIDSLNKAIEIGDANLAQKASNNIGVVELIQGNLQQAVHYFSSKWAKNSPTAQKFLQEIEEQERQRTVTSFIAEGVSYRLNGDFAEAITLYDKALALDPQNLRALEFKGYALYRMNSYPEAEKILNQAYELDSKQLGVVINLLKLHCASGKTEAAQNFFRQHREYLLSHQETLKNDGEFLKVCAGLLQQELLEP